MSHQLRSTYDPNRNPGGCWVCAHWHGRTNGHWRALVCEQEAPQGIITVITLPERGCAFWEREPGADDEVPPACSIPPT